MMREDRSEAWRYQLSSGRELLCTGDVMRADGMRTSSGLHGEKGSRMHATSGPSAMGVARVFFKKQLANGGVGGTRMCCCCCRRCCCAFAACECCCVGYRVCPKGGRQAVSRVVWCEIVVGRV